MTLKESTNHLEDFLLIFPLFLTFYGPPIIQQALPGGALVTSSADHFIPAQIDPALPQGLTLQHPLPTPRTLPPGILPRGTIRIVCFFSRTGGTWCCIPLHPERQAPDGNGPFRPARGPLVGTGSFQISMLN